MVHQHCIDYLGSIGDIQPGTQMYKNKQRNTGGDDAVPLVRK